MDLDHPNARWLKGVSAAGQPIYLAIVGALEAAVREGLMQPGDQLPTQRTVAQLLGIDLTTVTRAYAAARARGLLQGTVGRGTFVGAQSASDEAGLVDLSMNLPPPVAALAGMLRDTTRAILERTDAATLMAYHPGAGSLGQKAAGAAWLAPHLGPVEPERVFVCPGAQTALAAVFAAVTRPGDAVVVEPLTYPGLIALARRMGLRLIICAVDGEGVLPADLDRLCREERPRAVYLIPTLQNPVASTMGLGRRRDIAKIAEAHGLWIIEDDPYSRLLDSPPPALGSLAPGRTLHVSTLSKCLSPGVRIAYVVAPPGEIARTIDASLRAIAQMPSPLMAAVVTAWIRDGAADDLLGAVRREARARQAIAATILPGGRGGPDGLHLWLDLPPGYEPAAFHRLAQQKGLSLVTGEAFAAGPGGADGMRISLGGPARQAVLTEALDKVADLLGGLGAPERLVV